MILLLLLLALPIAAAERIASPHDAVAMAAEDLALLPEHDRPFQLYVWGLPTQVDRWHRIVSYAVNSAVSQSAVVIRPTIVKGGHLLRWDVRQLGVTEAGTQRIAKLLADVVQLDPVFYERVERVVVKYALIEVAPYRASDGKTYRHRWLRFNEVPRGTPMVEVREVRKQKIQGQAGRVIATYLGAQGSGLEMLAGHAYPIVSARHLVEMTQSTIDGGRYYEFVGIAGKNRDQILDFLGADPRQAGKLNAITGWAMVQSLVTGKHRAAVMLQGATGPTFVTLDFDDQQTTAEEDPLYQLLATIDGFLGNRKALHAAEEIISLRPNGALMGYLINPQNGQLANSVPDNIAKDHNIPRPSETGGSGTALVLPNTGCVICHGPEGGFKPLKTVLSPRLLGDVDIVDDLGDKDTSEAIDRLAAIFGRGSSEVDTYRALSRAREDYGQFVFRATWGWSATEFVEQFRPYYYAWKYDLVTPQQACIELGYRVTEDEALGVLRELLPNGAYEDRVIAFLKSGISVKRASWNDVYSYAMLRRKPLE